MFCVSGSSRYEKGIIWFVSNAGSVCAGNSGACGSDKPRDRCICSVIFFEKGKIMRLRNSIKFCMVLVAFGVGKTEAVSETDRPDGT